jgi:hypothetical protein
MWSWEQPAKQQGLKFIVSDLWLHGSHTDAADGAPA